MVEIAWGKKVSRPFKSKVISISKDLGCDPSHLMSAMAFESAETFSPKIQHPVTKATGLIQFMPKTARGLGTTVDDLAGMSDIDQLDYVKLYLDRFANRMTTVSDVYMTILYPKAVGKAEAFVLFEFPENAFVVNSKLDVNKDKQITKGEAASKVYAKLAKGLGLSLRG